MGAAGGMDMCRITVVGPGRRVDLALPGHVPFAELVPAVAGFAGLAGLAEAEAASGWVLQRLGAAPFPMEATPAQAGLADGELIYLSPRHEQLPELAFDDVADAIATGVSGLPDRWAPPDTRRVVLAAAVLALAAGAGAIVLSGPPWAWPALSAGVLAALLLAAAAAAARAAGDPAAAAVAGWAAIGYALLAGLLAPAGSARLAQLGALQLTAGLAAAVLAATVAAVVITAGTASFLGAVAAAALGCAAALVDYSLAHVSLAGAAAVTAAVALALTPLIPAAAFGVAGLKLPHVPRDADELRRDTLTVPGSQLLARTTAADRAVTGAASGLGLVTAVTEITLAFTPGWLPRLMCAVLGCAVLLRARVFGGRAQRLWLQVPACGGLALLALGCSLSARQGLILALVLPLLAAAAAAALVAARWLPGHRVSPLWGRAAELVDMTLVVSLIPLALGVTGLFGHVRGMSG